MNTSMVNMTNQVQITNVAFSATRLHLFLSDDREVSLPFEQVRWLHWLAQATPLQREQWIIEPGGYAVYWEELDDGVEIQHVLSLEPLM